MIARRWLVFVCFACACEGTTLNVLDGPGACVSNGTVMGLQARSTDEFVNSFGVKTEGLAASDPRTAESLSTLGARHIILSDVVDKEGLRALAGSLDLKGLVSTENPAQALAALAFFGKHATAVTFRDNTAVDAAWGEKIRTAQQQMFASVKANAATRNVLVAGPNVQSDAQIAVVGDISAWVDVGTFFPWRTEMWRAPPGLRAETDLARHVPVYGKLALIAPQTGYDTSLENGVSEAVQAKYVVRMLLEHFRLGVLRTFVANLADEDPEVAGQPSTGIGLLHNDGSPKPVFAALARTMALLADPGPGFVPGRLAFTLQQASANVHHLLLQKRNGVFYLLLWREVQSVDADVNEAVVLGLSMPAKSLTLFAPLRGAAPIQQGSGTQLSVIVPDSLAVVVIESACP